MKKDTESALRDCLEAVLTVQECAIMFNKNPKSVMMAIWTGRLIARQSTAGSTWLISLAGANLLWGKKDK